MKVPEDVVEKAYWAFIEAKVIGNDAKNPVRAACKIAFDAGRKAGKEESATIAVEVGIGNIWAWKIAKAIRGEGESA